jgi:broad-specificity NMP kinase
VIVHLNGWPGVGKLTVARLLAPRLQARLIDNHLLHDVAIRCAGIDDRARWPLYETVRAAGLSH